VWRWLRDISCDWAVIAAAFVAIYFYPLLLPIAILLIGNRQHALAVLGHDGSHFTLSKSRRVNDTLSNLLAAWPLCLTTSGYRALHLQHHKNTGSKKDPELAHRAARSPQWDLPLPRRRIIKYCLQDLCGRSLADFIIIVSFSKPENKRELVPLIAMHGVFILFALSSGLWWIAMLWYFCLATSFMMFFRLRTVLEHLGTGETHRINLSWWQRQVLAPHNIWYHWEHHKYPAVPCHLLPEVRKLLPAQEIISLSQLLDFLSTAPMTVSGQVMNPE
jgi:fatty acid desaturase